MFRRIFIVKPKTTVYIIDDNQVPKDNNKISDQKLRNIQSHHLLSLSPS